MIRTHTRKNIITVSMSNVLDQNIQNYEMLLQDCDDVVKRLMPLEGDGGFRIYISYIDVMVDRRLIEESLLEQFLAYTHQQHMQTPTNKSFITFLKDSGVATADVKESDDFNAVISAVLSGDTILFIENSSKALIVATRAWPNRGVGTTETEKVVRGPKEAFSETIRFNTILIRRRIRDTRLKVKQKQMGVRSKTDIALMYMEDLVRPDILQEVQRRLSLYDIDSVMETGTIEQLIEDKWYSPFPQLQFTERPDKAASAILEGRIVVVVDTTPFVLILPATLNSFLQASEDYYNRWGISSFIRVLRYIAMFLALCTPGLYIALTTFHPAMVPSSLIFSIAASRQGVPFYATVEVILMELAFELLREAGLRLPTAVGHTVGIVGGLIIGQAAVEANIASPIVVIVVSITAIASFSIPNDSMVSAIRLCKYWIIFLSAILGLYGFMLAMLTILIHLTGLRSFGIPYLSPFAFRGVNQGEDLKDSIVRMSIFTMKRRPIYSQPGHRKRLYSRVDTWSEREDWDAAETHEMEAREESRQDD